MLAGLAAQTLVTGPSLTLWAFAVAAGVFAVLLIGASLAVSTTSPSTIASWRTTGPAVKRWSGHVLMAVGSWFLVLVLLPTPVIGG